MTTPGTAPESEGEREVNHHGVAAFDFDGTMSRRDTLLPFCREFAGTARWTAALAAAASPALQRKRDAAKAVFLRRCLQGAPIDEFNEAGARYAATLPRRFRPETPGRLSHHLDAGHRVVIVSASLATYLRPLAEQLGVHDVIAVEMEVDDAGRLTGALDGPNVRGPEKARRLRRWLSIDTDDGPLPEFLELWAYGDSSGDDDLLALAHHPTRVG